MTTSLLNDDLLLKVNTVGDSAAFGEDNLLKIKTITRLKKLLQREKQGWLRVLHGRTGVGLTIGEFNTIVLALVSQGWCSLKEGRQGGVLVVFNENFTAVNVPELMTEPDQHNENR
jgi:hypothetical protein